LLQVKNGWMQPKSNIEHHNEVIVFGQNIAVGATCVYFDPRNYVRFVVVQVVQKIITQPMVDANFVHLVTRCVHSEILKKKIP
jgi:hypothetical protein